jgi:segregation and condensation protein A
MTISEGQAAELARDDSPAPLVPVEAARRVLDYLVWHKAIVEDATPGESSSAVLLEKYMGLVRNLTEGVHVIIDDPFQKATALLFELVMEEQFDPWEIDLVRFTQLYLERLRSQDAIDFAVSGKLVYMAWSILFLQSEELLRLHTASETPTVADDAGFDDAPLDPDAGYLSELTTPQAVDVTTAVLDRNEPSPLEEMIHHTETRPVTLLELVQAFGEAEAQARRALRIEELRERLRLEQRAPPEVLVHGDVPERDLVDAWTTCLKHPIHEKFPFLDLWRRTEGRDRLVAVFLAALFLERENVLELSQVTLGASPVDAARTAEARPLSPPPEA